MATIACEYLFILEGRRICYKCGKETTVIALGIGEHVVLTIDEDDQCEAYVEEALVGWEPIHLSWTEDERDIPPVLLDYLKANYNVKTGYSRMAGKCFANHCEHCGALQGNNYIMEEIDSPLDVGIPDGPELKERISNIKIKMFSIDENLQLNWSVSYCDNDGLYHKCGTTEEILDATALFVLYLP
jgi:hypothetical protein